MIERTYPKAPPLLALVLASLLPGAARADHPAEPVNTLPGVTSADASDARALEVNPAGLSFLQGTELRAGLAVDDFTTTGQSRSGLWLAGRLGAVGLGGSTTWLRDSTGLVSRRSRLALAVGNEELALGGAWGRRVAGDGTGDTVWDLGLTWRPWRYISGAVTVHEVSQNSPGHLGVGLAGRPLEDLTIGVDYTFAEDLALDGPDARLRASINARLFDGVSLLGQMVTPLDGSVDPTFQLGVALDLAHIGLMGTVNAGGRGGGFFEVRASGARYPGAETGGDTVVLDLDRELSGAPTGLFDTEERDPVVDLLALLDRARRDDEVAGVLLETRGAVPLSMATAEAIAGALALLQDAGKTVSVLLFSADDPTLYLAATADHVLATPGAIFEVNGLATTATYLGEGLSELGVKAEFVRIGTYKTAPEMFVRKDMSPAQAETTDRLLGDLLARYRGRLTRGRGLDVAAQDEIFELGIFDTRTALAHGVVDGIAFRDEVSEMIGRGRGRRARLVRNYAARRPAQPPWGEPAAIAVVPIVGTIVDGDTPSGPFAAQATGALTVIRALERASRDPSVEAIILRIDSPGGVASASDLIWRAVRQADRKKPVIASLGPVAASGGYYVAVGAREILAAPSTITGSIGIYAGHFDLSGLLDRIGIRRVETSTHGKSDMLGTGRAWNEAERERMQAFIEAGYALFLARVSEGRSMTTDALEPLAGGRVWTGAQAHAHGLVDATGYLLDAVDRAKHHAGLAPDRPVRLTTFGRQISPLSTLGGDGTPLVELPPALAPLENVFGDLLWMKSGVLQARLPARIEIR